MIDAHATVPARDALLRELGVTPLRLRAEPPATAAGTELPQAVFDRRIALAPLREETDRPELSALYAKIGEAVASLGMQCVRLADAQADPRVRVLAFGGVALPADIAAERVMRADALGVLHVDRARKGALWDALKRLAQESG
ncbi:MAG: hypothetical protein JSS21_04970 [Proteobacteria bacterium]|nr:hypothetical protein [Pseudomonadota bacterium]